MQSFQRKMKRIDLQPKHKVAAANKPGRVRRTQTIIVSKIASDANQKITKTITHSRV